MNIAMTTTAARVCVFCWDGLEYRMRDLNRVAGKVGAGLGACAIVRDWDDVSCAVETEV